MPATVAEELAQRLTGALAAAGPHTRHAAVALTSESEYASVDLILQRAGSPVPFGLWFGDGFPTSPDADGFAPEADVVAVDGAIVASYEQENEDDDGEVYEIVRIVAAYRSDGLAVTVNRYADPEAMPADEAWSWETLRALVLAPRWA